MFLISSLLFGLSVYIYERKKGTVLSDCSFAILKVILFKFYSFILSYFQILSNKKI